MTQPSYYKDGVPFDSTGQVIITITGGPTGSYLNPSSNPNASRPVYVNWPGINVPHGGGGIVNYNPRNLPFSGLYSLREGQKKINQFLEQARNAYPKNVEQVKEEANTLLKNLRESGLIGNSEINLAANSLQESVDSLQVNIELTKSGELLVNSKTNETEKTFIDFMNNNKLSNFIGKPDDMIDLAIATTGQWFHRLWDRTVPPTFVEEIKEKNNLVTYLDRVKIVNDDVLDKKEKLNNIKNSFEVENEVLTKTSELIVGMGQEVGSHLGDKYKAIADEIAGDIRNFQGKKIRIFDDAMKSLDKITSNPEMKINKSDRDALINAWKHVDAQDMANKLGNLGKAFKVADVVIKIGKVREKSIEGYETGNWSPLMLEVESWVLSGVASGVALGILAYVAPAIAMTVGLPVSAIMIAGIIGIGLVASFIDDKFADKLNNELIRPVH
ncbi:colicin-like pore-forming protein [Pectobacterium parmentieri]|uniref:colicin-like pore-forming protein n=1 Tax=Pectobacterium parmentieri TaxID=1905730 RepID=UPI0018DFE329|nr:colicin-like pore-forming protein [Pectobacterium parmentieri]MBI0552594.1 hypothetical protein [Pectobacterium parmentieri]MBI0561617.1 hypothetical protein [Pectobacterium parmentieri]MBI0565903.1 hypothetical protein [Pectobacterium parmentieri]